ncbi:hypothetical protein C8J57DRAFT_1494356 [Mycena rebaudengoi]|nr:hypothetical protein C8J57DRAFT_1494356 [Mycena rebaudengoi]
MAKTIRQKPSVPPLSLAKGRCLKTASALEKRLHRRVVLTPYAQPLASFESKKELISVFIDAVTAHQHLVEANILHHDISLNNIMMISNLSRRVCLPLPSPAELDNAESGDPAPTSKPLTAALELRRSLLIDMDYALIVDLTKSRSTSSPTLPFMAAEILMLGDKDGVHEPRHDLESLLHVLVWICVHYAGPRGVERKNFSIREFPLNDWIHGTTFIQLATAKAVFQTDLVWTHQFLPQLTPYFDSLGPCISAWRLLPIRKELTHNSVLAVLRVALASSHAEVGMV